MLRRLLIAPIAVLLGLAAFSGCAFMTPDDGRLVTKGGSDARDFRIKGYEIEDARGKSPIWVDERACVEVLFDTVAEAENLFDIFFSDMLTVPRPEGAPTLQSKIDDAIELGDESQLKALGRASGWAQSLVQLEISTYELGPIIYEVCDPTEFTLEDLDEVVGAANGLAMMRAKIRRGNFGGGPRFLPDVGKYSDAIHDHGFFEDRAGNFLEAGSGVYTCDQLISEKMVSWVNGEIQSDEVLNALTSDHHKYFSNFMQYVHDEVQSGALDVDGVRELMAEYEWGDDCVFDYCAGGVEDACGFAREHERG